MNCHEFTKKVEGLTLAELSHSADQQLLAHERGCATCGSWFQQKQRLAGALQTLRSATTTLEAPADAEREVLRAFRHSAATVSVVERKVAPEPFAFRLSRIFGWGAYAAAAAALAISLGLGFWLWQHSGKTLTQSAQQQLTTTEQPIQPKIAPSEKVAQVSEAKTSTPARREPRAARDSTASVVSTPAISNQSLAQTAEAQGYTPLMLCDPLSCSGDEQIVRMELPASAADGSQGTQVADVVVGDDGLVRAIRIVQQ